MRKVLTIGEPLVVFKSIDLDKNLAYSTNFKRFVAGAELNVCIGLQRLGINSIYISRVGDDLFGKVVLDHLKNLDIDTTYLTRLSNCKTGFYLKNSVTNADPDVFYYRKDTAINYMDIADIEKIELDDVFCGHFTGIMAALSENAYNIIEGLMQRLNSKSKLVIFDPNIRKNLWESEEKLKQYTNGLVKYANIFMPGINEAKFLTGLEDVDAIADWYFANNDNLKIIVIKLGTKGAYIAEKGEKSIVVPAYKVEHIVDTVGAGDGFAVGLISGLVKDMSLVESVKRACAIGALAVTSEGDNDGYPNEEKLKQFMNE